MLQIIIQLRGMKEIIFTMRQLIKGLHTHMLMMIIGIHITHHLITDLVVQYRITGTVNTHMQREDMQVKLMHLIR